MRYALAAISLTASCQSSLPPPVSPSAFGSTSWRYEPSRGYVRGDTAVGEKEFLILAAKTAEARRTAEAAGMYDLVIRSSVDASAIQEAYFGRTRALIEEGRLGRAHESAMQYLRRFPGEERSIEAKRLLFETAWAMVVKGPTSEGVKKLQEAAKNYPREDFSPIYHLRLADFLFDEGRLEEAKAEYQFVIDQYREDPVVPAAMFKKGECDLRAFKSVRLDPRPLLEADKSYIRVIDEFPRSSMAQPARARRDFIREQLALKEYDNGQFYEARGFLKSAALYYSSVLLRYPKTRAAGEAKEALRRLGSLPAEGK